MLSRETTARQFRALMDRGATSRDVAELIASQCDSQTGGQIIVEFEQLPRSFIYTVLTAWRMADEDGQRFEVISEPAPRPLEYARAGRVSYRIEHDEDGVRMYVNHVHGHHADWYKPKSEATALAV